MSDLVIRSTVTDVASASDISVTVGGVSFASSLSGDQCVVVVPQAASDAMPDNAVISITATNSVGTETETATAVRIQAASSMQFVGIADGDVLTDVDTVIDTEYPNNSVVQWDYRIQLASFGAFSTTSASTPNAFYDSSGLGTNSDTSSQPVPWAQASGQLVIIRALHSDPATGYWPNNTDDVIANGWYKDITVTAPTIAGASDHLTNLLDLTSMALIPQGSWTEADWVDVFDNLFVSYTPTNMDQLSLINDGGIRKIRQEHVASSGGSANVIAPMRFNSDDSGAYKNIKVRQWLELAPNFTFGTTSYSGKLGMYVGGGVNTAGGNVNTAGCTLRIAWDWKDPIYVLSLYDYSASRPNSNGGYGLEVSTGVELVPGVPILVEYEAQMNSDISLDDGWFKVWVNDILVLHEIDRGWMTSGTNPPLWNRMGRSEKHGGADGGWSPTEDTYALNWDISWEGSN